MKFLKKIDKTEIVEKMTRAASKCGYKLKKASPTIMIVGAAIGGVTATVLACKATIKAQDILTMLRWRASTRPSSRSRAVRSS